MTVRATQHLGRRLLPGVVAKLVRGELKILHSEGGRRVGDRRVRGQVSVRLPPGVGIRPCGSLADALPDPSSRSPVESLVVLIARAPTVTVAGAHGLAVVNE